MTTAASVVDVECPQWVATLEPTVLEWLDSVTVDDQPGHIRPCRTRTTDLGERITHPFSRLGLGIRHLTRTWRDLPADDREAWVALLTDARADSYFEGAVVDETLLRAVKRRRTGLRRVIAAVSGEHASLAPAVLVRRETRHTHAVLSWINTAMPPVGLLPMSVSELVADLTAERWTTPTEAAQRCVTLATFVGLDQRTADDRLAAELRRFLYKGVDAETGSWYLGPKPDRDTLLETAMWVLHALAWVDGEIPYPRQLLETCVAGSPGQEAPQIAASATVLAQCYPATDDHPHVRDYCLSLLDEIEQLRQPDGGFSVSSAGNATEYCGVPIATRTTQSDIRGTFLCVYALGKLGEFCGWTDFDWRSVMG